MIKVIYSESFMSDCENPDVSIRFTGWSLIPGPDKVEKVSDLLEPHGEFNISSEFEYINDSGVIKFLIESINPESTCRLLYFYYLTEGEKDSEERIAFVLLGDLIPEAGYLVVSEEFPMSTLRNMIHVQLPAGRKAKISGSNNLSEDTIFLEGPGVEGGVNIIRPISEEPDKKQVTRDSFYKLSASVSAGLSGRGHSWLGVDGRVKVPEKTRDTSWTGLKLLMEDTVTTSNVPTRRGIPRDTEWITSIFGEVTLESGEKVSIKSIPEVAIECLSVSSGLLYSIDNTSKTITTYPVPSGVDDKVSPSGIFRLTLGDLVSENFRLLQGLEESTWQMVSSPVYLENGEPMLLFPSKGYSSGSSQSLVFNTAYENLVDSDFTVAAVSEDDKELADEWFESSVGIEYNIVSSGIHRVTLTVKPKKDNPDTKWVPESSSSPDTPIRLRLTCRDYGQDFYVAVSSKDRQVALGLYDSPYISPTGSFYYHISTTAELGNNVNSIWFTPVASDSSTQEELGERKYWKVISKPRSTTIYDINGNVVTSGSLYPIRSNYYSPGNEFFRLYDSTVNSSSVSVNIGSIVIARVKEDELEKDLTDWRSMSGAGNTTLGLYKSGVPAEVTITNTKPFYVRSIGTYSINVKSNCPFYCTLSSGGDGIHLASRYYSSYNPSVGVTVSFNVLTVDDTFNVGDLRGVITVESTDYKASDSIQVYQDRHPVPPSCVKASSTAGRNYLFTNSSSYGTTITDAYLTSPTTPVVLVQDLQPDNRMTFSSSVGAYFHVGYRYHTVRLNCMRSEGSTYKYNYYPVSPEALVSVTSSCIVPGYSPGLPIKWYVFEKGISPFIYTKTPAQSSLNTSTYVYATLGYSSSSYYELELYSPYPITGILDTELDKNYCTYVVGDSVGVSPVYDNKYSRYKTKITLSAVSENIETQRSCGYLKVRSALALNGSLLDVKSIPEDMRDELTTSYISSYIINSSGSYKEIYIYINQEGSGVADYSLDYSPSSRYVPITGGRVDCYINTEAETAKFSNITAYEGTEWEYLTRGVTMLASTRLPEETFLDLSLVESSVYTSLYYIRNLSLSADIYLNGTKHKDSPVTISVSQYGLQTGLYVAYSGKKYLCLGESEDITLNVPISGGSFDFTIGAVSTRLEIPETPSLTSAIITVTSGSSEWSYNNYVLHVSIPENYEDKEKTFSFRAYCRDGAYSYYPGVNITIKQPGVDATGSFSKSSIYFSSSGVCLSDQGYIKFSSNLPKEKLLIASSGTESAVGEIIEESEGNYKLQVTVKANNQSREVQEFTLSLMSTSLQTLATVTCKQGYLSMILSDTYYTESVIGTKNSPAGTVSPLSSSLEPRFILPAKCYQREYSESGVLEEETQVTEWTTESLGWKIYPESAVGAFTVSGVETVLEDTTYQGSTPFIEAQYSVSPEYYDTEITFYAPFKLKTSKGEFVYGMYLKKPARPEATVSCVPAGFESISGSGENIETVVTTNPDGVKLIFTPSDSWCVANGNGKFTIQPNSSGVTRECEINITSNDYRLTGTTTIPIKQNA